MSARREQLLDLAERVLERDGVATFGVNALAREAEIKPPSLYKHFTGAREIEHALIARWFRRLAAALTDATGREGAGSALARLAQAYRRHAHAAPQLYRLATDRPLDRALLDRLDPGCEREAMAAILDFFDETDDRHERARLAWASAHGLVSFEIAGRFPPTATPADLDAAWQRLVRVLSG